MGEGIRILIFYDMDQKLLKTCIECDEVIRGRTDKRFCSDSCRSAFHNRDKLQLPATYRLIDHRLKRNRKILEKCYRLLESTKNNSSVLERMDMHLNKMNVKTLGFAFDYYTHKDWVDAKEYTFCYEYGYRFTENNAIVLIRRMPFDGDSVYFV